MSMHLSLTCKFLRQVGFALARTCRHLTPPELNAAVHGVCAGPDGCARGEPRALCIRRLRVPDPGECSGGPDQPAEQGLGVGGPCCPSSSFLPALPSFFPLSQPPWESLKIDSIQQQESCEK